MQKPQYSQSNPIEHNLSIELSSVGLDSNCFVQLSSICSEIELTLSSVFDFIRLLYSIHGLSSIEFDIRTFDRVSRPGKANYDDPVHTTPLRKRSI